MAWNVNAQGLSGGGSGGAASSAHPPPTPPSVSGLLTKFDPVIKRLVDLEENLAMLVGRLMGSQAATKDAAPTPIDTCILDTIGSRVAAVERLLYQIENYVQSLSASL